MKMFMKKKIKIGVVCFGLILVLLVLGLVLYIVGFRIAIYDGIRSGLTCKRLEANIRAQIEQVNYCQVDEDCRIESFDCPFSCGSYANEEADIASIKEQVSSYHERCGRCEYVCIRPLNPVCQNNKCVETQALCQPDRAYVNIGRCHCPEGTERFIERPEGGEEAFLICRTNKTNTTCKDDDFYAQQAMSFKYKVQDSSVTVSGCLADHPGSGCQEKTLNLALAQQFYLASGKEQSVKVVLEKIENNKAHFAFSYGAAPPACKTTDNCNYSCRFVKE